MAWLAVSGLGLEPVHKVDDIEETAAGASADQSPGDADGEMGLAGSSAADQHDITLIGDEAAGSQVSDEPLVDGGAGEVELFDVFGQWQLGDGQLVADRAGLLLSDLGLQQIADDAGWLVLALDAVGHDLVIGAAHPVELEAAHQVEDLGAFHASLSS